MTNKLIDEIRNNLDNGNVTSEMLFDEVTSKAKKYQDEYNSFVTIMDKKEEMEGDSILRGIPYALKDNISTKGILTTASSNILKDYIPLYDATIYKKLKESGAVLMGKTVLDELAMGGTGTTGHTGIVRNPWNKERMIGGSSAGSAAAVALGIVPFAIGLPLSGRKEYPARVIAMRAINDQQNSFEARSTPSDKSRAKRISGATVRKSSIKTDKIESRSANGITRLSPIS